MIASAGDGHTYRVRYQGRDVTKHSCRVVSLFGYGVITFLHVCHTPPTPRVHYYTQWGRVTVRKLT